MLSLPTAIHRKSCFLRSMHTVSLDWISQSRQLHMLHLVLQNILYEWPKLGANWIKGELGTNQPIYTTETDSHDTENRHVLVMEDGEGEGWIGTLGLVSQSVQSLSRVQLFVTPWTTARQASLSVTNSPSPPKPMSIKSVMPSNHLILCRPLLLLPSIFLSIRVFSNKSALRIRWPKYWSFSFSISPSNEHPGLRLQGTLKSLLQHHSWRFKLLHLEWINNRVLMY